MESCGKKQLNISPIEPSIALNAICPYYTMFPLDFPISVLKRFGQKNLKVLDPFCGRGTTIFAARLQGHQAFGLDCSPIAIAIARAKLAMTTETEVTDLAEAILEEGTTQLSVPKGEFWKWAYAPDTLRDMCILREGLRWRRSQAAEVLRAICLGALHGPLTVSVETRSYFSNQMPRTFASKPDYSVRYWRTHKLEPQEVDVLKIIGHRLKRLELDTLPKMKEASKVSVADSRLAKGYSSLPEDIDLVITSPPYYGMRTYISDQWLRNWFLGGSSEVPYDEQCLLSHQSPERFSKSLAQVWDRIGSKFSRRARMFVRFGAIPSRKCNPRDIMLASLDYSEHSWNVHHVRQANSASSGKRQAAHMGKRVKSTAINEFDYEISL